MENLKKGDIVCLAKDRFVRINSDHEFKVVSVGKNHITINSFIEINKRDLIKIGESQMKYEESNRYKLAQAIKKTGISAKALSRAVVGNESYFYNKTGVARFNKKGDISNEVLNLALTDLAFAEREVLGIGAKTVEDELYTAVVDNKGDVVDIVKTGTVDTQSDTEIKIIELESKINNNQKLNRSLFFSFAILTTVILIALFLIFNSQVV